MEWEAPAIVLDARAFAESDAIATVFTAEHGVYRGLARGGASRAQSSVWQSGNLVQARWVARLADQLGSLSAELLHPIAALIMQDRLALATLSAACAVTADALPEREPQERVFAALLDLVLSLARGAPPVPGLVAWELLLLAELGYALDLTTCAVTGTTDDLAWVSPKTGRAVSDAAAGVWRERLLPLPPFLRESGPGTHAEWADGLRLTGHFLERDAFGAVHRPLPLARRMLYDQVMDLATATRT